MEVHLPCLPTFELQGSKCLLLFNLPLKCWQLVRCQVRIRGNA